MNFKIRNQGKNQDPTLFNKPRTYSDWQISKTVTTSPLTSTLISTESTGKLNAVSPCFFRKTDLGSAQTISEILCFNSSGLLKNRRQFLFLRLRFDNTIFSSEAYLRWVKMDRAWSVNLIAKGLIGGFVIQGAAVDGVKGVSYPGMNGLTSKIGVPSERETLKNNENFNLASYQLTHQTHILVRKIDKAS